MHGEHPESVCHFPGPLCGGHPASHLSKHNVHEEGQISDCRHLGALVCDLLSAVGRVEGQAGELKYSRARD